MPATLDQILTYQAVCAELNAATEAVDGDPDDDHLSREFISPFTLRLRRANRGEDPSVLDAIVASGRALLVTTLRTRDHLRAAHAEAAVARLEAAYLAWRAALDVQ